MYLEWEGSELVITSMTNVYYVWLKMLSFKLSWLLCKETKL